MSGLKTFFSELRRRKVWLVAGIYLVAAWIVIQVVIAAEASLGLPPWVDTLMFVLAAAGFPLVLILAWAQESQAAPAEEKSEDTISEPEAVDIDPKTVAVLPFENLSPDPDNAYFAAGIHEEVLNELTKIRDLNVIARTSVQQYLETQKTIPEIAKELSVANVMEGSVRYAGDRVRVTAQLIDGSTNLHLWSETFDRVIEDIFGIQSDIALGIASALKATLSPDETRAVTAKPTENTEAFAAQLRGRAAFNQGNLTEALAQFGRAVELDPKYADALAQKAAVLAIAEEFQLWPSGERPLETGEVLADRALEIDPSSGLAWWARGVALRNKNDVEGALAAFRRGIELTPGENRLYIGLALQLAFIDRLPEAEKAIEQAAALDPTNSIVRFHQANIYRANERLDDAVREADTAIFLFGENRNLAISTLAEIYVAAGQEEKARETLERAESGQVMNNVQFRVQLAVAWMLAGNVERAESIMDGVDLNKANAAVRASWLLVTEGPDEAIQFLEAEFEKTGWLPGNMNFIGSLLPIHNDPRFRALMKKVGLVT